MHGRSNLQIAPPENCSDSASLLSYHSDHSVEDAVPNTNTSAVFRTSHIGITSRARITCKACKRRCVGQVVQTAPSDESSSGFESGTTEDCSHSKSVSRVHSDFYHVKCFSCSVCSSTLVETASASSSECESGYFVKDDRLFCAKHYQILYGEKCSACNSYLAGEIMAVLGRRYHKSCLNCSVCSNAIKANERVSTFGSGSLGHDILCGNCSSTVCSQDFLLSSSLKCAGCHSANMRSGDTILALGYSFHAWCFKCANCNSLLDGLYFHCDPQLPVTPSPSKPHPYPNSTPKALCASCFYLKNCSECYRCQGKIAPGEKRLEIGNRSCNDQVFTFHPNCAKCFNCQLWFAEGEEIVVREGNSFELNGCSIISAEKDDDNCRRVFMHKDCSESNSKKFIESVDLNLRIDQRESYNSFRKFLRNVPEQLKSPSSRRSWAFPSNFCSSVESYLPKTGSQYRLSYLEPRNLATCGGSYLNSMYCRFIVPSQAYTKQEKIMHYLSLKFHEEKQVEMAARALSKEGVQIYPKEVLSTVNKVMPKGVDRCKLESHLSESDFFSVFHMSREEFYRLPAWKQNFLKKINNLF